MPVVHIGQIDWDMGKNFPAEMAVRADLRETLLALRTGPGEVGRRAPRRQGQGGTRGAVEAQLDGKRAPA